MYSISEVYAIPLLFVFIIFNSDKIMKFFNSDAFQNFLEVYKIMCESNFLILDYTDIDEDIDEDKKCKVIEKDEANNKKTDIVKVDVVKYEDKYLNKFKTFPNEFVFQETDIEEENKEYEKIKIQYRENKSKKIVELSSYLERMNDILENGGFNVNKSNDYGITKILDFFDIDREELIDTEDSDEDSDTKFDNSDKFTSEINKLLNELLVKKHNTEYELDRLNNEDMLLVDKELKIQAHNTILNNKLDKYINNYVLEYTPVGNVYMRYNNKNNTFEYFSNSTVPYRYLEPIGRKYVMTYWCKPLFVDLEEELKKAEERYEEKKEEMNKCVDKTKTTNSVVAQLKSYNNDTKDNITRLMKNRSNKNGILPPQIHVSMVDINKNSDKQLLKENANRYTWEGRLTNFCPLKKIDKKIFDKNLSLSYSDFKKLQNQNKK